jgi:GT2 family glycosyltransferase
MNACAPQEDLMDPSDVVVYDTDNYPPRKEAGTLCEARANIVAVSRDPAAPLVSIIVPAYNRIEKTKLCIESVQKYTKGIDYELILFDHGSTDGTFSYLLSVEHPRKKIIKFTRNTTKLLCEALNLTCSYIVVLNNDVVVTKDWLSNLLACAQSDRRIGIIVPASSNVSNFQEIDLQFDDIDDMQRKAAAYNASNPRKWHERLRLVTPLYFMRKECFDLVGLGDYAIGQFMDDDLTFNIRRAGYKAVLCRDTFVHHNHDFRNAEDKDPKEFASSLQKGREHFKEKHYGIDAWDDVNNYEPDMVSMVNPPASKESVEVLGTDVRCGTPILEIKNRLRDHDVFSTRLSALCEDPKYYLDLKTICDGDVFCGRADDLPRYFDKKRFDYVVLGEPLNTYAQPLALLRQLLSLLKSKGQLLLRVRNTFDVCTMVNALGNRNNFYDTCPAHMTVELIQRAAYPLGGVIQEVRVETNGAQVSLVKQFTEIIEKAKLSGNINETVMRLFAENYVLNICRTQ